MRRKRENYAERKNKDGSVSRFAIPTVNGKSVWRRIPDTPEYAGKRGARRYNDEVKADLLNVGSRETFAALAEQWLKLRSGIKASTLTTYESALRLHLLPRFGDSEIADIKSKDIQQWVAEMVPERVSANFMQMVIVNVLRLVLEQAVMDETIPRNPARFRIQYPASSDMGYSKARALTVEEVRLLLQHTTTDYWIMFSVAIWTGLRLGELLAMQWKYLDLKNATYKVERTLAHGQKLTTPKTKSSRDTIQLSAYVCELLERHRAEQAALRLKVEEWIDRDLIFPIIKPKIAKAPGRPHDPNTVYGALTRAAKRAGLGHVKPHDLRHTCASLLISQNLNIKQINRQMRHANTSITWDTYGHLYPEDQTAVAETMDKLFGVGK